ncbi:MAG: RND superfamily putative drug exporter [Candidatus Poriferisodalaceae bacterium]|jgi:RND superfamily putative drug exporter
MSHALYRLGCYAAQRPWVVIGAWFFAALMIIGASTTFGRELTDSFDVPGLDSQAAIDLVSEADSDQAGTTAEVVVTPLEESSTFFDSPQAGLELAEIQAALAALPNVLNVSDLTEAVTSGPESAIASGSISPDGRVAIIRLQYPITEQIGAADLENLKEQVAEARSGSSLQIEMSGELFFEFEEAESGIGEMAGVLFAAVILLVAFGSLVAMGLPIGMALFGLAIGISSMSLITYIIDIPSWAPQMASMIGLGVGIDYALFLLTRHREHLDQGMSVEESVGRAVATAGQAVIFAGGTVVIAILGLAIAGVPFMTAAGVATSIVVLIMVLASVTLLPAFLGLSGPWINRLGIHRKKTTTASLTVGAGWLRWGRHVSKNAWSYAIGVTVLLLALASPVLVMRLGTADDGTKSVERTERRAYDLVAEGFGAGINGPLIVAIDISADPTVVESLVEAVSADEGIASLAPAAIDSEAGVATLLAFPTTSPQDAATLDTIQRLRSEVLPSVLEDSPARAHIGGQTASSADIGDRVNSRLPLFITAVLGLSFLLLMMVFRSVLVPLKAALLNLLSIGSAYGVLVMVFQWGWGAGLIGLESTAPIDPFIPMFMFAVLFGLSMDYEVFLLSRVREEYLATGDNDTSVIRGIASTARVITSAALIMISVFGGFIFGNDPTIKMFGLGLATAIFVDASIVRMVLVPATMKLMGDANWWLPDWLDRLLPTIDIDGDIHGEIGPLDETGQDSPELRDASAPDRVLV